MLAADIGGETIQASTAAASLAARTLRRSAAEQRNCEGVGDPGIWPCRGSRFDEGRDRSAGPVGLVAALAGLADFLGRRLDRAGIALAGGRLEIGGRLGIGVELGLEAGGIAPNLRL